MSQEPEPRYEKIGRKDWPKGLLIDAGIVIILVVASIFLLPRFWYLWLALVMGGLYLLVRWHSKHHAYQCPNCGHSFEIGTWENFISPHGVTKSGGEWTLLRCPACKVRGKAEVLKKL